MTENVQSMMQRIRARLVPVPPSDPGAATAPHPSGASASLQHGVAALHVPPFARIPLQPALVPAPDGHYRLHDLFLCNDEAFVRAAFHAILKREPDPDGLQRYLAELRAGAAKSDVLKSLRYSDEGRAIGAKVHGLGFHPFIDRLERLPVLGRLVSLARALWSVPASIHIQHAEQAHFFNLVARMQDSVGTNYEALRSSVLTLHGNFEALNANISAAAARLERTATAIIEETKRESEATRQALAALRSEVDAKAGRREVTERTNQLIELVEARALRSELGALSEQLNTLIRARALKSEVDALAHQLTTVIEALATKTELKALREELRSLLEQRARVSELESWAERVSGMIDARALKSELDALAHELTSAIEALPRRPELAAIGAELESWSRRLSAKIDARALSSDVDLQRRDIDALRDDVRTKAGVEDLQRLESAWRARHAEQECILVEFQEILRRNASNATSQFFESMYAGFEDRFRGARDDIKERHRVYLPYLGKAAAGRPDAPVIDLGCGRGEWLELLHEERFAAKGVDLNPTFLQACHDMGLDVTATDILEYLRGAKPDSAGAITLFHVAEHLPFDDLIELVDESLRVLKPGGLFILETPDPSNVVVGACSFYMDPTHRRPLPRALSEHLIATRGFTDVEVLPLHPVDADWLKGATDRASLTINHFFFGPQDYAVLGRKPKRRSTKTGVDN